MIETATDATLLSSTNSDVIVIGAGPAGIVLALELARASIDVVLLEAGSDRFSSQSQQFYRAESVEPESHGQVDMFRRRVLGGSTSVWGGRCIPFDPIDFETRPWMKHAKWPISFENVAAYYPKALEYSHAGMAAFTSGEAFPDNPDPLLPGIQSEDVILDRIERFSQPTDFGRRYRSQLEKSGKIRLLLEAPVTEVLTSGSGKKAAGARVRLPSGKLLDFVAPNVILAVGGLETVRLLLTPTEHRPTGLGNDHDLVGRFYQCHLEGEIGRMIVRDPANANLDYAKTSDGIYGRRYAWLSPDAQRRNRLSGLVLRPSHPNIVNPDHLNPILSAMYLAKRFIVPEYAKKMTSLEQVDVAKSGAHMSRYLGHFRNIAFGTPKLLPFAYKWTRHRILAERKLPSVVLMHPKGEYPIDVNAEQEPNFESRISLGHGRDQLGVPRLRIDWRTTEEDHARLGSGLRLIQNAVNNSCFNKIIFADEQFESQVRRRIPVGGHHIGTARMAKTPVEGVCNGNCELFDTEGVFIAGAAAFSTSGFANPTLTILALTLRLSDHLISKHSVTAKR